LKFFVINGPNLNLLGVREPELYGHETLLDIKEWLNSQKESEGHSFLWFQSNHEGEIIDHIHSGIDKADGIIINPGAFTHYSYAIRDAIESVNILTVEVHLSNIHSREDFRKTSVIKDVCIAQYFGLKKLSYLEGLKKLLTILQ
jgi:3-dehydroquinate dehydratase-2|tara:strand:+ start:1579 stop:2010 length:432 start_codon:yes stop_codon:yes gene_type:complete